MSNAPAMTAMIARDLQAGGCVRGAADGSVKPIAQVDASRARTIVILIHGMIFGRDIDDDREISQGEQTVFWMPFVAATLANDRNAAICIVRWDSLKGPAASGTQLEGLLGTLLARAKEPVSRTITLVGYSAGGNHAKSGLINARRKAPHTMLRLLTLGTPHEGAPLANQQIALTTLGHLFGAGALLAQGESQGVTQLRVGEPSLRRLNERFIRSSRLQDRFAIAGADDAFVPSWSACPKWMQCNRLDGINHGTLLVPFDVPGFEQFFSAVISGRQPDRGIL